MNRTHSHVRGHLRIINCTCPDDGRQRKTGIAAPFVRPRPLVAIGRWLNGRAERRTLAMLASVNVGAVQASGPVAVGRYGPALLMAGEYVRPRPPLTRMPTDGADVLQ